MKAFSISCLLLVGLAAFAFAEPSASPKSDSGSASSSAAAANEMNGTLVELVHGQSVVINTGTQNQRFKLSAQAHYFNPKGKQIEERKLKKDRKVRVHYMKQGDDMIADRVSLVREGGKKKGKQPKKSSASQKSPSPEQ